ncbi:urease accessory protein [Cryobacterium sp. Hh7]|uniref:urease accessory protein UreD n=1 Tax=Cryobacterium sp. Hh7 TaxID=1259159 RepID=UPI00106C1743|nr:urease accessory protein UreD [Cryobacterium sp. Hh7]TFD59454.1 urease accessory protein [Cryobacterium sp. Hh7]
MGVTAVHLAAAPGRARLTLGTGALVPRTVDVGPRSARVALVAAGALLLGGDRVHVDVVVGAGCTLELEDVGGTVAYDADGEHCEWTVSIRVESDALLLWHGLPFVVADGAHVSRSTSIELADSSSVACVRETIVLGRTEESGGFVDLRTHVTIGTEPLFLERLPVRGTDRTPGILGDNRVLDTVLLAGLRAADTAGTVTALGAAGTELLQLELPGSLARSLHIQAHRSPLALLWENWRDQALSSRTAHISREVSWDDTGNSPGARLPPTLSAAHGASL